MTRTSGTGKINVKLIAILVATTVVLVVGLYIARQVRRRILSNRDFREGNAAYDRQDWGKAARYYEEYLGRNPDNLDIWKRYGEANMSVRPIEGKHVRGAIIAYRRLLEASPDDALPYEKLAALYTGTGLYGELAWVARKRLEKDAGDLDAPVWLGQALLELEKLDDARKALMDFEERLASLTTKPKHPQCVQACALLAEIEMRGKLVGAESAALGWLDKAVEYDESSAPACLQRALFYRTTWLATIEQRIRQVRDNRDPDAAKSDEKRRAELRAQTFKHALADLAKAHELPGTDPNLRLVLCKEWVSWADLDADTLKEAGMSRDALLATAGGELESLKDLDPTSLKEEFFEQTSWVASYFLVRSELMLRRGVKLADVLATEDALEKLGQSRHRLAVLPNAIRVLVTAGEAAKTAGTVEEFLQAAGGLPSQPAQGGQVKPEDLLAAAAALEKLAGPGERVRALLDSAAARAAKGQGALARQILADIGPKVLADRARAIFDEYAEAIKGMEPKPMAAWQLALLEAGIARLEKRVYRVIGALEPVTVAAPNNPQAWRLLAEAYSRTDQTRRAVHALTQYLRLRPRDPEMTLQLAREYLKLQDWNRAFETARLAEPMDPTDIVIKLLRIEAGIYLAADRRGDIDQAEMAKLSKELVDLREKGPNRVDIRILQAIIDVYQNRHAEAEKKLKQAIQECDEKLPARMHLVRHYHRIDRPADALQACQEACREHSEVAEPWLALSGLHVSAKEYDAARQALREGLAASKDPWERRALSIRLGLVELVYGSRAEGIKVLQTLAANDPNEVKARSLLLDQPEVRRDAAETAKRIAELRAIEGDAGLLWRFYQATALLGGQDWRSHQPEITELLGRCTESDPEWSAPVLLLVTMHQRLSNVAEAEKLCRDTLKRNPSATEIAARLVSLLERQDRLGEAQEVLKQLDEDSRAKEALSVRLALGSGEYSRAIEELKLRARGNKQDADSRILLARLIYWQTKDVKAALDYLDQAQAIAPDSVAATDARIGILHGENRDAEARQILDQGVQKTASFADYLMRGSFLAATGDAKAAEEDFKKLTAFPGREARGYEALASFYAGAKRIDETISTLREAAGKYPQDLSLKQNLMRALLYRKAEGDAAEAERILAELEGRMPDHPELLRLRAVRLLRLGTAEANRQAGQLLERVVELEPTSVSSHLTLVGTAMQRREYAAARDYAIRALGSNPNQPLLTLARAQAERALGNFRIAAELTRQVLSNHPESPEARAAFYEIAATAGDPELLNEALAITAKAIAARPDDEASRLSRTQLLLVAKQADRAISELEAFCKTPSGEKSVAAFLNLAELYRTRGDTDKADANIQKAEKIAPEAPAVVRGRMLLMGTLGQYDRVAALADQHRSNAAGDMGAVLTAANILATSRNSEDRKKAIEVYEYVVEKAPWSIDAKLGLAGACAMAGDIDRAEGLYREVLQGNPNDPQALNDLAWVLTRYRKLHTAALKLAEEGLAIAPTNRHLLDTRGEILSNLPGRLNDAKADFEKVLSMAGEGSREEAKALLQLGRLHVKLDNLPEAKRCLTKATRIDGKLSVFTDGERKEIASIVGN